MSHLLTDRRAYLVSGRVQGVGFRWWTRKVALQLGLTGMVRNLADGRVEVAAAGDPATLAEFRELLATGPTGAHVSGILETSAPDVPLEDFTISR